MQPAITDLVLLDVEMPGMGGVEACREIKRLSQRPAVVMLKVPDRDEVKAAAFEAGADDYLTKPCRLGDLVARVRAVLGGPPVKVS